MKLKSSVLLIAYGCEPGKGSEPGTGWNLATRLAKELDVTVVTRANNKSAIEAALVGVEDRPSFHYVDPPQWAINLKKKRFMPVQVFYTLWHWAVYRRAKAESWEYDVCHHLTFNSFEIPPVVFLCLKGKKVWGPIGGGQSVPNSLLPAFGKWGAIKEWMRNIRVKVSAYNPLVRLVMERCSFVYFANHETRSLLQNHLRCPYEMMIDVGVDVDQFKMRFNERDSRPGQSNILAAGFLSPRKGVYFLVEALKLLMERRDDVKLTIVGDGPAMKSLKQVVVQSGMTEYVTFCGSVSHEEMALQIGNADLFVFPSVRDTSGTIVLEAMAVGLPVVAFDHQGAAIMIDADHGELVKPGSIDETIRNLAGSIETIIDSPERQKEMSLRGRKRIEDHYSWEKKVARISDCYKNL